MYFALECLMDMAAHQLRIDPVDIRLRNLIRADQFPYHSISGGIYDSGNYEALLDNALALIDYHAFREQQKEHNQEHNLSPNGSRRRLGIGVAAVVEPSGSNMGYISVAFTPQERARQLPKSGCTAAATVAVDPLGGIYGASRYHPSRAGTRNLRSEQKRREEKRREEKRREIPRSSE